MSAAEAEIGKIDRELDPLLDPALKEAVDRINVEMVDPDQRKREIEALLADVADIIRMLVEDIVLTRVDGKVEITAQVATV